MLLLLTEHLVATFGETRHPASRKYVAEQSRVMPNSSITFQTFWWHLSVFPLDKKPKYLNFQSVFTSSRSFGGYFQPTTLSLILAELGKMMPNSSKSFQTFWSHFFVFPLENQPKNLNFPCVFTSNSPFGGYFQWKRSIDFQKICSWTRYNHAKFVENLRNFLVAPVRFCFR